MTRTLTAPGELHTAEFGAVTISAQLTTDGGVTITIWPTTSRHDAIAYTYADKGHGRRAYATIAQLATTGHTAEQVADLLGSDREHALAQVRQILNDAQQYAAADPSRTATRVVTAVQAEIERIEPDSETARLDRLAADINRHLDTVHGQCRADDQDTADPAARPRTLRDLAAGIAATHPKVKTLAEVRNARRRVTR